MNLTYEKESFLSRYLYINYSHLIDIIAKNNHITHTLPHNQDTVEHVTELVN
jgi:hypothetical protein